MKKISLSFASGFVAATLVAVLGLFALHFLGARESAQSQLSMSAPMDADNEGLRTSDHRNRSLIPTIQSLEELKNLASGFERTAALRRLLASSDEARVIQLLRESEEIESNHQKLNAQIEIFRRLASMDPEQAMSRLTAYPQRQIEQLLPTVVGEWVSTDLEGAMALLSTIDQISIHEVFNALIIASESVSEKDLRDLAQAKGYEGELTGLMEELAVENAIHDPETSWNTVLNDSWYDGGQIDSLVAIAEAWIARDGWSVLDELVESMPNRTHRTEFVDNLLQYTARHDPTTSFEQAVRLYTSTDSMVFYAIVREWAHQDPFPVLEAISNLDDLLLQKDLRQWAISIWAGNDPKALLEFLPNLSEDNQLFARKEAIRGMARLSPHEAIELMSTMQGEIGSDVVGTISLSMSKRNAHKALEWALSDSRVDVHRFSVLSQILPKLAAEDPKLAMRTAIEQPMNQWGQALETYVVRSLLSSDDKEQAIALLPQVRPGQTKLRTYITVGFELALRGDAQTSIELGKDLNETLRENYYVGLMDKWISSDPQGLFNSLDQLPSEYKMVAASLLRERQSSLLESQWEYVDSLVSE